MLESKKKRSTSHKKIGYLTYDYKGIDITMFWRAVGHLLVKI